MPELAAPKRQVTPAAASTPCGPAELLRLKREHLVPCVYHFYKDPPQIVAGRGCRLIDHEGRSYLDCYSGVTVMSAGHCNEAIIEPAIEQIRTLQHTTTIYLTEPVLRLAETLAEITPGNLRRSFFCASGSEAVEGGLHAAAQHTGRPDVVALRDGLHGRTRWAMSVTGLDMWRTDPFPLPGVHHVPFGDAAALAAVLERHGDRIGAVVGETVQGNGGINVPGPDYWPAVRALCDRHGAKLVLDEIQSGMNRTGRWFACEHWGVTPDVICISKALGNGFPIAAFVTTDEIAASCTRPGASTHGGNPVSAAAALATIELHRRLDLGRAAAERGRQLSNGLVGIARRGPVQCVQPRGLGLMMGVPIVDREGEPSAASCDALLEALKDRGVLAGKTGPGRNVLTFMPPLTVTDGDIGELLDAVDSSFRVVGDAA